ncbi:peptidylprolyl isomerase [Paenibacillus sp. SYP-B4298]|uniref:peptidylprolyl isomerase n=1 Tax=Paenibacillus sp. SYP-B4298 TaxID=2996034 RepID=UPI0022DE6944|nr:peptidylprolyl isomerase [Paenibacillus sp. SYP-B4298]
MKNRNKPKRWLPAAALLTLVAVLVLFGGWLSRDAREGLDAGEVVATIDGHPVKYGELRLFMERQRSLVVQQFYTAYGAVDQAGYWYAEYGTERPIDVLLEQALDEALDTKALQVLAQRYGLVEEIDYETFHRQWIEENDRREQAAGTGEVIYGPEQYDEAGYYRYLTDRLVLALQRKLAAEDEEPSAEALANYYLAHRDRFGIRDELTVRMYTCSVPEGAEASVIEAALQRMKDWQEADAATRQRDAEVSQTVRVFDNSTSKQDTGWDYGLYRHASMLQPGEWSEAFYHNGFIYVLEGLERKPGGYLPLEDVLPLVKQQYAKERYAEAVRQYRKQANIVIEERLAERMRYE